MADISQTMALEIAENWEQMAAAAPASAAARRETLRECADLIRMVAESSAIIEDGAARREPAGDVDMLVETKLLTRGGDYVTTIAVPPFQIPVEVIAWGERVFVRNRAGEYREGIIWFYIEPDLSQETERR